MSNYNVYVALRFIYLKHFKTEVLCILTIYEGNKRSNWIVLGYFEKTENQCLLTHTGSKKGARDNEGYREINLGIQVVKSDVRRISSEP